LHQRKYAHKVLKRFHTENYNAAITLIETNLKLQKGEMEKSMDGTLYKQIVGSLRFLCNSRLNISYVVGLISRFMSNPKVSHMVTAKRILRYLTGIVKYGLLFLKGQDFGVAEIKAYSNSY